MSEQCLESIVERGSDLINEPDRVLRSIEDLSLLVIMFPGKWSQDKFLPNCYSKRKIDWFEGTGTIIGVKRNRVFILSSIHCIPGTKYSFFVKGCITQHQQVPVTLVLNQFIEKDNGIDIAIFSCDIRTFDEKMIKGIDAIGWYAPQTFRIGSPVWLVHYPTSAEPDGVASTHRLFNECFPTVSSGTVISFDFGALTVDSTIIATGGSSGGIVIDENGRAVAVHDSQHDETPDHKPVSTHRMVQELRDTLRSNKQLCNLFD